MDTNMRKLLLSAEKYSGSTNPALQQLYNLLQSASKSHPTADAPESFGHDLYVLCAEFAFEHGYSDIARNCIKMFFMKHPPANQFLCRAYLCQAQLAVSQNANNLEQLEMAVAYILKAVSFAKDIPRYHFLVYNASVIYWKFCRPFLKPGYRQHLAQSLIQIVKALDDINDSDHEWRAQLMMALVECFLDARRPKDASQLAMTAATFIKSKMPSLYKTLFCLMVRHNLVDAVTLQKEIDMSPELAVYNKICRLKNEIDPPEPFEVTPVVVSAETVSQQRHDSEGFRTESPVSVNFPESQPEGSSKKDEDISNHLDDFRSKPKARDFSSEIQSILFQLGVPFRQSAAAHTSYEVLSRKQSLNISSRLSIETSINRKERLQLLLEIAHLCIELNLQDLALVCVEAMKLYDNQEPRFCLELEFVECILAMCSLKDKQESYQKTAVDVRLKTITRCEEAVMNAIRQGNPQVIQSGCVILWNLCLPLLQPNMRSWVNKPLTIIAEALENIDSLLIQVRCQVYMELARFAEDQGQIKAAMIYLNKALLSDDGDVYRERIEALLHRLELRTQLYTKPVRLEDQAAMIIEQARKEDSGTTRLDYSLLVKAGEALAPDDFILVLDSENEVKDEEDHEEEHSSAGKESFAKLLAGKAANFYNCVKKAEWHLRRLDGTNDKERARLWGDLAKTARKQEVWDVCRVACRFCLLYDDGRWGGVRKPKISEMSIKTSKTKSESSKEKVSEESTEKLPAVAYSQPSASLVASYDRDLIRMIAEVAFINGEALVQFLRSKNVQLNDKPLPPENKRIRGAKNPEDDPDWITYCNWIKDLSEQATNNFLRGLELGVELDEAWIVCSAAAYVWNYNTHILNQGRHAQIVPQLTALLEGLQKVGYTGETVMLVNICDALAQGLIRSSVSELSKMAVKQIQEVDVTPQKPKTPKTVAPAKSKQSGLAVNASVMADLKKAIDICEFAMQVTNGDNPKDVVPIFIRLPLLQTWVQAKQLAQQQISKHFGPDYESSSKDQMSRCIVALEMLSLNKNGNMEFKDAPELEEIIQMVENTKWTDKFLELQIWTRLTSVAFESHNHYLVMLCSKKALRFSAMGTQPRNRKMNFNQYTVEQEMFSYASVLQGQSIVENMQWKESLRREALSVYLNSIKFARTAGNYELVMTAARHFWNTCLPFLEQPMQRELLKDPIKIILECIMATAGKKSLAEAQSDEKDDGKDNGKDDGEDDGKGDGKDVGKDAGKEKLGKPRDRKKSKKDSETKPPEKKMEAPKEVIDTVASQNEDDNILVRAAMYGVLIQCYFDKEDWKEAFAAIDKAMSDMPRSKHRLLIIKHRAMVKLNLGYSVDVDMQKFQTGSEEDLAYMWHRLALNCKETAEQLVSFQRAIETLESETSAYLKAEYLLEFGQWLYSNQFPLQDAKDQIGWAIDILFNIKSVTLPDGKNLQGKQGKGIKQRQAQKKGSNTNVNKSTNRSQDEETRKTSRRSTPGTSLSHIKEVNVQRKSDTTSDSEIPLNANKFIPVARVLEIGVLPVNTKLAVSDLMEVCQLDILIRSHVLLAEVNGTESRHYRDLLLMACEFLMRLWKVLISVFGSSMKEIGRIGVAPSKDDGRAIKNAKKDDKKEEKKKEEKYKSKRRYLLDTIPSDLESWATYDWPDEGIEAFKLEDLKLFAITPDNITKPMLTYYYLDVLITRLREIGYHYLTLPVLAFQDLLSRSVLKSHALYKLVHLRFLEVCQELNIKSGVSHHLKIIGPMLVNVEEQAMSRIEIAQWQVKQKQMTQGVLKEKEKRRKQSNKSGSPIKISSEKSTEDFKTSEDESARVLSGVSLREVWTDTAEILIRQGMYQRAREFLNEAKMAAEAFDEQALQTRIILLFARLAYHESQYGLTISLCQKSQELKLADEKFWFESCILQAKAMVKDNSDRQTVRKAKKLLMNAVTEFAKVGDKYPNRLNVTKFYCVKLEEKLLKIHVKYTLQKNKDLGNPQILEAVLQACERYEYLTEELTHLRMYRDVVRTAVKHGRILRTLAKNSTEKELLRIYYFQTLNIFREAALIAEKVYADVHTLFPLAETKGMSTPVQRELADINIELGEIMTDILIVREEELRHEQLQEERKSSIVRLVQEYTREPPVYEENEKQWIDLGKTVADEAMSLFTSAHSLCTGIPLLKAKSLAGLGRLLRVVGEITDPDSPSQWIVYDIEVLKNKLAEEEASAKSTAEPQNLDNNSGDDVMSVKTTEMLEDEQQKTELIEDEKTLKKKDQYSKEMAEKKKRLEISKFYYMCASECLAQCLNVSMQHGFTKLIAEASLELLILLGQHDTSAASMMLSLHQSCQASLAMEKVLFKSQPDPMTSQLAALLHQRYHLLKKDIETNISSSSVFRDVSAALSRDWQAWKKLEITSNHLDLIKEFPSNYNIIILQHSPDKNFLYAAILDKSKVIPGNLKTKGGEKSIAIDKIQPADLSLPLEPIKDVGRSRVYRLLTDFNKLKQISCRFQAFKQKQQNMYLKIESHRTKTALKEKMMNAIMESDVLSSGETFTTVITEFEDLSKDAELQKEFSEIVDALDAYLKSALKPICDSLSDANIANVIKEANEGKEKDKVSKENMSKHECAVLLADPDLLQLPLETITHLHSLQGVNSVSRDFSLQMLYNRSRGDKQETEQGKVPDGKKKAKDAAKLVSRIPGLREAKQRQVKIIPVDRPLMSWQVPVNTHLFRYIVDPFLDSAETETHEPVKEFEKILQKYEQQFTPKWLGLSGSDHTPSVGEWEIYLTESSSFIFYGMERLLAYIPPHKMSALNIPDCQILFSFDQIQTTKSDQRQIKLDAPKRAETLDLEMPMEMAMLASMAGIRSILLNQWYCSLCNNAHRIKKAMTYMLQKGKTTGQTTYLLQNPGKAFQEDKSSQNLDKTSDPHRSKRGSKETEKGERAAVHLKI